ncbi:DUF2889 domain-containing protein [Aestuariispira ectoiniformans]|uniref:DUF2889 domain-containing protein n=1 Tax=Aestuariispira ectoiniformans TaxID=2775080 RepID=UPI00223C235D|nr:DUF2889 domain-containing protein [Aestuariispira ectoiniformans]
MPLSEPVKRHHIHTRRVECFGYIREDGLWDIEGHMTDVKTYGFTSAHRGEITPGEPIHNMWLRLTLDDTLTIRDAEASTDHAPYNTCAAINPDYKQLIGHQIRPGFTGITRKLFGGTAGCTHLTELLGPIATTAFQTIFASNRYGKELIGQTVPERDPDAPRKRPPHLGTCHALALDGEVVRDFHSDFYEGEKETVEG